LVFLLPSWVFNLQEKKWHTLAVDDCTTILDSSAEGIPPEDVARRQNKYGFNTLAEPEKSSAFMRFISQYNDPLNYLLIGAALVALAIHPDAPGDAILF